ncbi:MAG: hypothetical protein JOZ51_21520 [Chloroflexi bacterium]|nr:hypothetical protein [Chloroflexota bacterium]
MTNQHRFPSEPQPEGALPVAELGSTDYEEVLVPYTREAQEVPEHHAIHQRRIVPPVPEGAEVADPAPSPAIDWTPRLAAPGLRAASEEIRLVRNVALDSAAEHHAASEVGDPSVAINGSVVFYTGNWYAAASLDGGATFRYVDPFTAFPKPIGMSFCCDQVVHYIKKIDMFVWLLQYSPDQTGANLQRLAFARSQDVRSGRWRVFDITAQQLGLPNVYLDDPDLAIGTNMLYLTVNGFLGQQWTATVLVRIPLSGIRSGNITAQHTISRDNFSFRVAQNCGKCAFWAAHNTTSSLRVFSWEERADAPTFNDITVARWAAGSYRSQIPGGMNWLGRADPRITGATKAGHDLWFAWGANRGGTNGRPQPYIQIARINSKTLELVDNLNLWDEHAALGYASLSSNSRREVGVSYMLGGGERFPSHAVGILTGTRRDCLCVEGLRGPARDGWGDYLTIRRCYPRTKLFAATGYTMQHGAAPNDATPHFVIFGRSGDV